jgi:hypothetical protein
MTPSSGIKTTTVAILLADRPPRPGGLMTLPPASLTRVTATTVDGAEADTNALARTYEAA